MKTLNKFFTIIGLILFVVTLTSCEFGSTTPKGDGITFVTNCDLVIESMENIELNTQVILPKPTRKGYLFAGWYTSSDLTSTKLPVKYTYTGPVTLYADWMPIDYLLRVKDNSNVIEEKTYTFKCNEEIIIENPTSDYFDFIGWVDKDGNEVVLDKMPDYDMTIYPVWEGKSIVVKLDLQGGVAPEGFVSEITGIKSGDTVKLLSPSKSGHLFKGWYDGTDGNAKKYTSNTSILTSITLYAQYESLSNYESEYDINYELNGGTLPSGSIYKYEVGKETLLPKPTKTGYEFGGWYESPIFYGNKVEYIDASTYGEVSLYAKWKEIKSSYTVQYIDYLGYSEEVQVESGQKVALKQHENVARKEIGWYLGSELFDFSTPITEDIVLRANWSELETRINMMVPEVFVENTKLNTSIVIGDATFKVSWKSSHPTTLTTDGVTNPDRIDTLVELTGKFTYKNVTITHVFNVVVPKVELKDLSNVKPVFAYVYAPSFKGFTATAIETIDVVNLSFGRLSSDNTVSLRDVEKHLMTINQIRKTGTRVVLSIGGGGEDLLLWSQVASTSENRMTFAKSLLEIVETYHLDGVDIDWEYPGFHKDTNVEVDRPNYTLLMATINQVIKQANPDYYVTAALPGGKWGIDRYQVNQVIKYMDYLHLMTYDFHDSQYAFHHTALYASSNTSASASVHDSVEIYKKAGAPISKLVIGCAFYGRVYVFSGAPTTSNGLGSGNVASSGGHMTYTDIYNYMKNNKGQYVSVYDANSNASGIYIPSEKKFISYDNANSIKAKCNYVWAKDLAGIMYWENGEDTTDILLTALNEGMKK